MTVGAKPCRFSSFLSSFTAAALSRLGWTMTSSTSPSLSTARHMYRGDQSNGRYIGSEFDLDAGWQINQHLKVSAAYVHFFAGSAITNAGGKDVDYVGAWAAYKF